MRIIFWQKLSIVVICALCRSVACLCKCSSSGLSRSILSIASPTLLLISEAAAFVKVTTSSLSISTRLFLSDIICIILSTSTAVLPEPAAADTSIFLSRRLITSSCSLVHFASPISNLPFYLLLSSGSCILLSTSSSLNLLSTRKLLPGILTSNLHISL